MSDGIVAQPYRLPHSQSVQHQTVCFFNDINFVLAFFSGMGQVNIYCPWLVCNNERFHRHSTDILVSFEILPFADCSTTCHIVTRHIVTWELKNKRLHRKEFICRKKKITVTLFSPKTTGKVNIKHAHWFDASSRT